LGGIVFNDEYARGHALLCCCGLHYRGWRRCFVNLTGPRFALSPATSDFCAIYPFKGKGGLKGVCQETRVEACRLLLKTALERALEGVFARSCEHDFGVNRVPELF
jgi:hypothetical protein